MQKKYTTEGQADSGSVQCVSSINLQSRAQHMGTITSALFFSQPPNWTRLLRELPQTPPRAHTPLHPCKGAFSSLG